MKNILETYSEITESEKFKQFKEENSNSFLSSVFLDKTWQFNFSNDKKITTFFIKDSLVETEESDVYEINKEIKELNLEDVKINLEKAEELIKKVMEKEKINETVNKKIIILQQRQVPIWNLTYITSALNVFNIRINAISGEILEQKFENIMKFKGQ